MKNHADKTRFYIYLKTNLTIYSTSTHISYSIATYILFKCQRMVFEYGFSQQCSVDCRVYLHRQSTYR